MVTIDDLEKELDQEARGATAPAAEPEATPAAAASGKGLTSIDDLEAEVDDSLKSFGRVRVEDLERTIMVPTGMMAGHQDRDPSDPTAIGYEMPPSHEVGAKLPFRATRAGRVIDQAFPEASLIMPVARGALAKAPGMFIRAAEGAAPWISPDDLTDPNRDDFLSKQRRGFERFGEAFPKFQGEVDNPVRSEILEGTAQSLAPIVAFTLLGVPPKIAAGLTVSAFAGAQYADALERNKKQGMSDTKARAEAGLEAASEATWELISDLALLGPLGKSVSKGAAKVIKEAADAVHAGKLKKMAFREMLKGNLGRDYIRSFFMEYGTEQANTATQHAAQQAFGVTGEASLKEKLLRGGEVGGGQAAFFGVISLALGIKGARIARETLADPNANPAQRLAMVDRVTNELRAAGAAREASVLKVSWEAMINKGMPIDLEQASIDASDPRGQIPSPSSLAARTAEIRTNEDAMRRQAPEKVSGPVVKSRRPEDLLAFVRENVPGGVDPEQITLRTGDNLTRAQKAAQEEDAAAGLVTIFFDSAEDVALPAISGGPKVSFLPSNLDPHDVAFKARHEKAHAIDARPELDPLTSKTRAALAQAVTGEDYAARAQDLEVRRADAKMPAATPPQEFDELAADVRAEGPYAARTKNPKTFRQNLDRWVAQTAEKDPGMFGQLKNQLRSWAAEVGIPGASVPDARRGTSEQWSAFADSALAELQAAEDKGPEAAKLAGMMTEIKGRLDPAGQQRVKDVTVPSAGYSSRAAKNARLFAEGKAAPNAPAAFRNNEIVQHKVDGGEFRIIDQAGDGYYLISPVKGRNAKPIRVPASSLLRGAATSGRGPAAAPSPRPTPQPPARESRRELDGSVRQELEARARNLGISNPGILTDQDLAEEVVTKLKAQPRPAGGLIRRTRQADGTEVVTKVTPPTAAPAPKSPPSLRSQPGLFPKTRTAQEAKELDDQVKYSLLSQLKSKDFPIEPNVPRKRLGTRQSYYTRNNAVKAARAEIERWGRELFTLDGTRVRMDAPDSNPRRQMFQDSADNRAIHVISDERTGEIIDDRLEWLPMVPETLKGAPIYLEDGNTRIYARRYSPREVHLVVVNLRGKEAILERQGLLYADWATQYPTTFGAWGKRSALEVVFTTSRASELSGSGQNPGLGNPPAQGASQLPGSSTPRGNQESTPAPAESQAQPGGNSPAPKSEAAKSLPSLRDQAFRDSKVRDADGNLQVVYHGGKRPDRIGSIFRADRATSGPMQYFTDSPEIASRYAVDKKDTSFEAPEDYAGWFKFKVPGSRSTVDLDRVWYFLPAEQRRELTEKLPHVSNQDLDGESTDEFHLATDHYGAAGKETWDWQIQEARGNVLKAAKEIWLNGGVLFDQEERFLDLLRVAGLDGVQFDSPYRENPAVFPVYLNITRPLDTTTDVTSELIDDLKRIAARKRGKRKLFGADAWDKNTRDPREWVSQLEEDTADGANSFVWTSIPDWVTDYLKSKGFDGIHDTGGKSGGDAHSVWVPFYSHQIKSATGNVGTYGQRPPTRDEARPLGMTAAQALKAQEKGDIRFSLASHRRAIPAQRDPAGAERVRSSFFKKGLSVAMIAEHAIKYWPAGGKPAEDIIGVILEGKEYLQRVERAWWETRRKIASWSHGMRKARRDLSRADRLYIRTNFLKDYEEGGVDQAWQSPAVAAFAEAWRDANTTVSQEAGQLIESFAGRDPDTYVPHRLTDKGRAILQQKNGPEWDALVEAAQVNGIDIHVLESLRQDPLRQQKYGSIDYARIANLPWEIQIADGATVKMLETDPEVLFSHIRSAARRLSTIEEFGADEATSDYLDQVANGLVYAGALDSESTREAVSRIWKRLEGQDAMAGRELFGTRNILEPANKILGTHYVLTPHGIWQAFDSVVAALNLSGAVIGNVVGGHLPESVRMGFFPTMMAIKEAYTTSLKNPSLDDLHALVDLEGDLLHDLASTETLEGKAAKGAGMALQGTGFVGANRRINFAVARAMQKRNLQLMLDSIAENKQGTWARRWGKDAGFAQRYLTEELRFSEEDVERMVLEGPTDKDMARAIGKELELVNAMNESPGSRPRWVAHPIWRMGFAYSTFVRKMYDTTKFAAREAKAGNVRPMATLLVAGTVTAEAMSWIKDFLKDREEEEKGWIAKLADEMTEVGALGLAGSWKWAISKAVDPDRQSDFFSDAFKPPHMETVYALATGLMKSVANVSVKPLWKDTARVASGVDIIDKTATRIGLFGREYRDTDAADRLVNKVYLRDSKRKDGSLIRALDPIPRKHKDNTSRRLIRRLKEGHSDEQIVEMLRSARDRRNGEE